MKKGGRSIGSCRNCLVENWGILYTLLGSMTHSVGTYIGKKKTEIIIFFRLAVIIFEVYKKI